MNIRILDKSPERKRSLDTGMKLNGRTLEIWRGKYRRWGKRYTDRDMERWIIGDLTHEILHVIVEKIAGYDATIGLDDLVRDGRGWVKKKVKWLRSWGLA